MNAFPIYRASGTHRELGRAHGEQAKAHIHGHLDGMCRAEKWTRDELKTQALRFQSLFEQVCPHLLEELSGLAEGAGITLAEAIATNTRSVLTIARGDGCTSFAVSPTGSEGGQVLIGQNSDMLPETSDWAYVLHLQPDDKPQTLMWTFGGMIGYHGINEHEVGQFANDLGGGPPRQFAMPHYPIKRLIMECRGLTEVKDLFARIPVAVNANYVLCDGEGEILDIETTTVGPNWITDEGRGFIAHSNHFICPAHATVDNYAESADDSFSRLDRMNELMQSRAGSLTLEDLQTFLRDRQNGPTSICRTPQTSDEQATWVTAGMTVASIVAEPARRRLHIAKGDGDDAQFTTYTMDT